jgi:hypothetical protein
MVVVGAGPVGLELAQAFQKLGSQVTLIEGGPRMLPNHEEFARVQLTTALRQDGVEILTARRVVRLGRNGDTYVVTTCDDGTAEADRVTVAVGRKAPTADIGLQNVGLTPVAFSRSTSTCACGACRGCMRPATSTAGSSSHIRGTYQARIAVDHILGDRTAVADRRGGGLLADARLADPRSIARGAAHAGRRHTLTPWHIRSRNALDQALTTESSPAPAR